LPRASAGDERQAFTLNRRRKLLAMGILEQLLADAQGIAGQALQASGQFHGGGLALCAILQQLGRQPPLHGLLAAEQLAAQQHLRGPRVPQQAWQQQAGAELRAHAQRHERRTQLGIAGDQHLVAMQQQGGTDTDRGPATAAISGLSSASTAHIMRNTGLFRSVGGWSRKSGRSLPAVKHSALPVNRITSTCGSSLAASNNSASRVYMALVSALSLSGRFRRRVSRPSSSSCRIRSVMGRHLVLFLWWAQKVGGVITQITTASTSPGLP
jgi:hypothetical protein